MGEIAGQAVAQAAIKGQPAEMTARALLRNRDIAERLGCLNMAGLEELHHGRSPTIGRGPARGDQLSVDLIIRRTVCPGLVKVIVNLEFMPALSAAE